MFTAGMLMRLVYDEAEARWCEAERPRPRPRIFFETEVEANNYEYEADAEASCLLLLQDVYYFIIPCKNLENI